MEYDRKDELYHLFGELIGRDPKFMRQWVRLFTITHKRYMETLARNYFVNSDLTLTNWCKGMKSGDRADELVLFVLCVLTGTHCFVHLKQGYWTSLKDIPAIHLEFVQCCNVHLSYLGNGIFVEHELCTVKATYKIFGIDQPIEIEETKQVVIGTLTSTENETLDKLMELTCTENTETASPTIISEDLLMQETKSETEHSVNIKPALNLVPLEPDFTEDETNDLYIMPTEFNPAPIHDKDSVVIDQSEMDQQQTGITDNKKENDKLATKNS